MRRLRDLATPAELAAKRTARPKIAELSTALSTAGLTTDNLLLEHLDAQIRNLRTDFERQLDLNEKQSLPALIQHH